MDRPSSHLHFSFAHHQAGLHQRAHPLQGTARAHRVQMKIEMLDKVTWMDRFVRQQDFQVTMGNVTGFTTGAFAPFFETTSPLNLARHRDTRVDELFQQWRTTMDPTAQAQVTEQLQSYLADKLYLTGLANTPFFHGV
jgi:ABC-type transport system substrate-binding protein